MKKKVTIYVRPMDGYTLDDIDIAFDSGVIESFKRGDHHLIIKPAREVEALEFVCPSLQCISFRDTSDDILILRGQAIALCQEEDI